MQRSTLFAIIGAVVLVLITLPFYLTIGGLSLMAFDAPDAPEFLWRARIFVMVTMSLCLLIPFGSLFMSIRTIRRNKIGLGFAYSVVPIISLGIFWLWLSQQSFT